VALTENGAVASTVGGINIGAGEVANVDALRCRPPFCLVATTLRDGSASFIYNVSASTAAILYRAPCPGVCHNLHLDFASGNAFTLSIGASAQTVRRIDDGLDIVVADVTNQIAGGKVYAGQTTHCSAFHSMYIGVRAATGSDFFLTVDLRAGRVTQTTTLNFPLFSGLWATCDGSNVVGGVTLVNPGPGRNTVVFGTTNIGGAAGTFTQVTSAPVADGLQLTGLLTATSPASASNDLFIAALYAPMATNGSLFLLDPYDGDKDNAIIPMTYLLISAAWDRA